jgi:hypothetical protein
MKTKFFSNTSLKGFIRYLLQNIFFLKILFVGITQFSVKGVLISHIRDCDNALKGFGATTSVQYERGFNASCLRCG